MVTMPGIFIAILVFLSLLSESYAACGDSGLGDTECVLLQPYYFEYQWATCLTDEYIRRVSNQRHACRGITAQHCWYQCQLEVNGLEDGSVYDNCRCSTANTLPTPDEDMPTLPPHCFSPGGIDCRWYRECLEVRYPCEGTEDGYAIEYAEKYCNLYIDHYNNFSPSGRLWIDGVRNCLQIVLVPSLRPWVRKTCADIRNDAFKSHSRCYITPALGAPSICELPCFDVLRAFFVVNVIGGAIFSTPLETGIQMLQVMRGCLGTRGCVNNITETLIITIPRIGIYRGTRFFFLAVTRIGQFISRYINFDGNGIGWFPYFQVEDSFDGEDTQRPRRNALIPQPTDSDDIDDVVLLLADLKVFNISTPLDNTVRRQTLNETIVALSDAVRNGALSQIPLVLNDEKVTFGVSSLGQCGDTFCSNKSNVIELATASGSLKIGTSLASTSTICIFAYMFDYILK